MKKIYFIYKTTCVVTNKFYIGMHSTNNIADGYIGSGKRLWYSINKYGKENHICEILEYLNDFKSLKDREKEIVNHELLKDPLCMNLSLGGGSWNPFTIAVKDKFNNVFTVYPNDSRYLSGELVSVNKGTLTVKDKNNSYFKVNINDPRYLSGELVGVTKGKLTVKDINNNSLLVSVNDPRYLSGELIPYNKGNKVHTEDFKKKIGEKSSIHQKGEGNSQFGKCWIYNLDLQQSKSIKKELLDQYLTNGWIKGRKMFIQGS